MNLLSKYQSLKRATEVFGSGNGFSDSEKDILQGFKAHRALNLFALQAKEILEGTLTDIIRRQVPEHLTPTKRTEIPALLLHYAADCDRFPSPHGECQNFGMRLHSSTGDLRPWCGEQKCWCFIADPSRKNVDTSRKCQRYQQKALATAKDYVVYDGCCEPDPRGCHSLLVACNAVTGEQWALCRRQIEEYTERECLHLDEHGKHQRLARRLMRRCPEGGDAMEPPR